MKPPPEPTSASASAGNEYSSMFSPASAEYDNKRIELQFSL